MSISIPDLRSPPVDQVGVEERAAKFRTRSIKKDSKMQALRMALGLIDLTTLEGRDTAGKVRQMCYKAAHLHEEIPDLPNVAAVCVYPAMVPVARKEVEGTGIYVASVATAFPSGQSDRQLKLQETRIAVDNGADEIDMVISRGAFLRGEYSFVHDEIAAVKDACQGRTLKVILETGELCTLDNVRLASDLAILAGADFIKTSTGKVSPAATMPVTLVMLQAIKDHFLATGKKVGMKPAGGISDAKTSIQYLVMLQETLGSDWLNRSLFRFGASSLANSLLLQVRKQTTGYYQSPDYFSIG
ncbi:MAG: deoxyribose-phosphate aldolase [Opitutae bacterium]